MAEHSVLLFSFGVKNSILIILFQKNIGLFSAVQTRMRIKQQYSQRDMRCEITRLLQTYER